MNMRKKVILIVAVIMGVSMSSVSAESIGGISLGMPRDQVVSLYGQPQWIFNKDQYAYYTGGYVFQAQVYSNGLAVVYNGGYVQRVAMLKLDGSNRELDWSGLNLRDELSSYNNKYGNSEFNYKQNNNKFGVTDTRRFNSNVSGEYLWVSTYQGDIKSVEINHYDN